MPVEFSIETSFDPNANAIENDLDRAIPSTTVPIQNKVL